MSEIAITRWLAWSTGGRNKPGLIKSVARLMTGSTTHPVSRSSTTDANERGRSPLCADNLVTRSTSPPIVVGRKFETNNPARYWLSSVPSRAGTSSATSTRCHRNVASTTPASVTTTAALSQRNVAGFHNGATRCAARGRSTASIAMLTTSRMAPQSRVRATRLA